MGIGDSGFLPPQWSDPDQYKHSSSDSPSDQFHDTEDVDDLRRDVLAHLRQIIKTPEKASLDTFLPSARQLLYAFDQQQMHLLASEDEAAVKKESPLQARSTRKARSQLSNSPKMTPLQKKAQQALRDIQKAFSSPHEEANRERNALNLDVAGLSLVSVLKEIETPTLPKSSKSLRASRSKTSQTSSLPRSYEALAKKWEQADQKLKALEEAEKNHHPPKEINVLKKQFREAFDEVKNSLLTNRSSALNTPNNEEQVDIPILEKSSTVRQAVKLADEKWNIYEAAHHSLKTALADDDSSREELRELHRKMEEAFADFEEAKKQINSSD